MKSLLVDGNAIMYAAQHHSQKLRSGDIETTAVFGFLRTLRRVMRQYPGHAPIILWDARKNWRYDIYPDYKGNRKVAPGMKEVRQAVKSQRPLLELAMRALGFYQATAEGFEADDIAGYYSRKLIKGDDSNVVLVTGDRDWQQLINESVSWFDPRTDSLVNFVNFEAETGYNCVENFLAAKALIGDTSDNIKGVNMIGEKACYGIFEHFESIDDLFERWVDFDPKGTSLSRARKAITTFVQLSDVKGHIFERNMLLMNLIQCPYDISEAIELNGQPLNTKAFTRICERLAFFSILKDLDAWINEMNWRKHQ